MSDLYTSCRSAASCSSEQAQRLQLLLALRGRRREPDAIVEPAAVLVLGHVVVAKKPVENLVKPLVKLALDLRRVLLARRAREARLHFHRFRREVPAQHVHDERHVVAREQAAKVVVASDVGVREIGVAPLRRRIGACTGRRVAGSAGAGRAGRARESVRATSAGWARAGATQRRRRGKAPGSFSLLWSPRAVCVPLGTWGGVHFEWKLARDGSYLDNIYL
jgi:hypothetical protein